MTDLPPAGSREGSSAASGHGSDTKRSGVRYRTIVADPPWPYDDGFPSMVGPGRGLTKRATRPLPYPSMPVDEILALPVSDLAERDAALFLWTTNRYLHQGFDVIDAWGFSYRQTLVWVKSQASPFVASVAPNHSEYLLVARRGNLRWKGSLRSNVITIQVAPQWQRHSAKPDAFCDYVEEVSDGPYLELFSRRTRLGWDTWGNEALEHVEVVA